MVHAWCSLVLAAALAAGPSVEEAAKRTWSVVTVLPGDTVEGLAQRFDVSPERLCEWNDLEGEPAVGRRLRVHSVHESIERFRMRFRVKEETTWRALADRYELPLETVLALNKARRNGKVRSRRLVTVYVTKDRWNGLWLDGALQLADGEGIRVKHPKWAWGRPVTVRSLEEVGRRIAAAYPGSALVVGDLSKKRGGRFPPHSSHRGGLDADLGFFHPEEPFTMKFKWVKPRNVDLERTWFLLESLMATGRVKRILLDWYHQAALYELARGKGVPQTVLDEVFQYPAKRWKKKGLIRHYKGHKNHLHVRFLEPEDEVIL